MKYYEFESAASIKVFLIPNVKFFFFHKTLYFDKAIVFETSIRTFEPKF